MDRTKAYCSFSSKFSMETYHGFFPVKCTYRFLCLFYFWDQLNNEKGLQDPLGQKYVKKLLFCRDMIHESGTDPCNPFRGWGQKLSLWVNGLRGYGGYVLRLKLFPWHYFLWHEETDCKFQEMSKWPPTKKGQIWIV